MTEKRGGCLGKLAGLAAVLLLVSLVVPDEQVATSTVVIEHVQAPTPTPMSTPTGEPQSAPRTPTPAVTSPTPDSSPTPTAPSSSVAIPAYIREPCSVMPSLQAFDDLGFTVDDLTEMSTTIYDGAEEADTLSRYNLVAVALCETSTISIVFRMFETSELAHEDMAVALVEAPIPEDPTAFTRDVAEIPGAKLVASPDYWLAGIYWVNDSNVMVSVPANDWGELTDASTFHETLIDAATELDGKTQ